MASANEKEVRVADEATASDVAEGSAEPSKAGEEEDTGAQIAPIVKLEEVAISTGKENEDVLIDM
jgi:Ran-binding protein 1